MTSSFVICWSCFVSVVYLSPTLPVSSGGAVAAQALVHLALSLPLEKPMYLLLLPLTEFSLPVEAVFRGVAVAVCASDYLEPSMRFGKKDETIRTTIFGNADLSMGYCHY